MRHFNFVLFCSITFGVVMLMGLSIQSCKAGYELKQSVELDSVGETISSESFDSLSLLTLFERYHRNFEFSAEYYIPITDSSGAIVGSVLSSRIKLDEQFGQERDSTVLQHSCQDREDSTFSSMTRTTDAEVGVESDVGPPVGRILGCIGLLLLLYIAVSKLNTS